MYIYRRGNRKVILGPAGRALRGRPAGKKKYKQHSSKSHPMKEPEDVRCHQPPGSGQSQLIGVGYTTST